MSNLKHCSFCGKEESEHLKLVKGNEANICEECLVICTSIFNSEKQNKKTDKEKPFEITPQSIIEKLNQHVINQEHAKKTVATSIYNHYKRIHIGSDKIKKSDLIISGPSGCGKTTIVSTVAKILNIPFVSIDATKLTQSGYVGADVEGILTQLLIEAEGDIEKAQNGIIFIDEFDKILKSKGASIDIGGESVQRELLKVIEGGDFYINKSMNKRSDREELVKFNTKNNLFICAGAFEGIYEIIKKRLNIKKTIGFSGDINNDVDDYSLISKADDQDFIDYGFMKEIIGRIPIKTFVNKLNREDLFNIMKYSEESPIQGYKELLSFDNIDLEITDSAIEEVANKAISKNIGARGIKSIFENRLLDVMFEAPTLSKNMGVKRVIIDGDYISGKIDKPIYESKQFKKRPKNNNNPIENIKNNL